MWAALAGCSSGSDTICRVGADCASGTCLPNGTCAEMTAPDGGRSGPDAGGAGGADASAGSCAPNHDGVITRGEFPVMAGESANFLVATDVTVDTAGTLGSDGTRHWDLSKQLSGDANVDVVLQPVAGSWFASSFSGATYATQLSQKSDLLGVFEINDSALLLRGIVSPKGGAARTELTYDPPVKVLVFPLTTKSTWSTDTSVSGVADGIPSAYSESYDSKVDAVGDVATPYGTFPVLRVQTSSVVTAAAVPVQSFSFVSECYGQVAEITSQNYETSTEFTDAAEVRRLAK